MPVLLSTRVLRTLPTSRPSADLVVLSGGLLVVVAGTAALVPVPVAVALGGILAAASAVLRLGRPSGVYRPAVLLDAAVLAAGSTAVLTALVPVQHRAVAATLGLAVSAGLFGAGLHLLPGRTDPQWPEWVRTLAEPSVASVGLCFTVWVLLPDGVPQPVRLPAAVVAGLLAVSALTVLTGRYPRFAATCRGGALLTLLGQVVLVATLAAPEADRSPVVAMAALLVGAVVTSVGVRQATDAGSAGTLAPDRTRVRAVVPAVVVLTVGGHYFATVEAIEPTVYFFGLAVVPPLVLRELIRTADRCRQGTDRAEGTARVHALVAGGRDLVLLLDADQRVIWQSPAGPRLFGLADTAVVGRLLRDLVHPDDVARVAARLASVEGENDGGLLMARLTDGRGGWRETESTVSDQRSVPELGALVLHVRDVGDCRRLEQRVLQLAVTDQLTGVANRCALLGAVAELHQGNLPTEWTEATGEPEARPIRPRPPGTSWPTGPQPVGALLIVELHGLSGVNDGQGRAAGDGVLIEAARRLRTAAGPQDLVARLTGDEFAVLTPVGPVPAYALATRMLTALSEPYRLDPEPADQGDAGPEVRLQHSIGLAEIDGGDPDGVLRQADLARRRAAQLGRDRIEWYDEELEQQLLRRLELERGLPGAAARGELDLVYQPVLDLTDRSPVGVEALVRWRSPELGTVLPGELLPVAQTRGLMGELGRWVLTRACRQLADWTATGATLWVAVNVTSEELLAPEFVRHLCAVLAEYGLPADRLLVEISEPQLPGDEGAVAARLGELRAIGVQTALDDFRTEHASLSNLRRLPLDLLKISPDPDGADQTLLDVLVGLGDRLGLTVVAEGLESMEQVGDARRSGCRYGQGYALARPATAERVEAYFEERSGGSDGTDD
ncbi:EAL domain-containing protein [Micromonospora sp. NPDC000207]|uniref:EAL domain-containing protein n=1 Tax=Micromonospora sp. NPDC000207 TaxID=3154246 RepID=UPI00332638D1